MGLVAFPTKNQLGPPDSKLENKKKSSLSILFRNIFQEILFNHFRETELSNVCSQVKLLKIVL